MSVNRVIDKKRIIDKMNIMEGTGCWQWQACIQSNGYARVTYKYRTMGAHRLAYMLFIGVIPKGFDVCHSCDNRSCVNPAHLFIGTRDDNMKDCVNKGRQKKGEDLKQSKLTNQKVLQIRELKQKGLSTKKVAMKFGITQSNARYIIRRNTWRHI